MAKPPPSPLDKKVLARRQKDLEGFIDQHTQMLEQRQLKYAAEIEPMWKRILTNISNEIEAIFNLVQDANGVPIVKQPIKQEKMRNMKRQIARLGRLRERLIEMMGVKRQTQKMSVNLAFSYAQSYYFHLFGMEQAARVTVAAPLLTLAHVVGAIINPWLPDGKTYSDRIRANTEYLADKMVQVVEQALGSGWSINRTAREIQKRAGEGYYNAVRLARTEMTRAAAQGANHSYMQNADIMDGKRWNAILDLVTAEKDAQNDGEIFSLSYDTPENPGQPGKRIPNHPNCRCKWSPVLSALGISTKERIARDQDGNRIYTKARTYKEYAKERGLPDVDEAVRNANPRNYLRRGETEADIPADFFGAA
ncbi:minor capsid protein [Domibacillus indicus]|uniref:minor capsid protein n=1 Tax=Domibacillus indicus TaxID=1437523 RepID=UPI00204267EB|nr:minor capsid protein [Domibacillus indicus]MCM3789434.1 minor capsid protein [Domibacillus indicus]